jgi:hypothetical protein
MKTSIKAILKRLERLEQPVKGRSCHGLMYSDLLSREECDSVGPDQRIVVDHYMDKAGRVLRTCERITSDPSDLGTDYSHSTWDCASFEVANRRRPKEFQIVCKIGRFFLPLSELRARKNRGGPVDSCEALIPLDQVGPLGEGPDDGENTLIPDI